MNRFRTHTGIVVLIAVTVLVMVLSHSVRVRLEWGTGGFVLGLIAGAVVTLDMRHHRKRREEMNKSQTPGS
jgi:uncharacterized membrane protein YjfL (UPF0719 family)